MIRESIPALIDYDLPESPSGEARPRRVVHRGSIFTRGGSGGGFLLNLGSWAIMLLTLTIVAGVLGGGFLGARWLWSIGRPALDNMGIPFASHVCSGEGTGDLDPVFSDLGILMTGGKPTDLLRKRFAAGDAIDVRGSPGRRFVIKGGVALAVHDASAPGGLGAIGIRFSEKEPFCHLVTALGLPVGKYKVQDDGSVTGPHDPDIQLKVAPRKGKVQEFQLHHVSR